METIIMCIGTSLGAAMAFGWVTLGAVLAMGAANETPNKSGARTKAADLSRLDTSGLGIDANYPGGNIIVVKIEKDTVALRQDLGDTQGWWFYWNFRVRGAAGKTLTFKFTDRNPIGVRGPAVSTDGGASWAWLGRRTVRGPSFRFRFPQHVKDVRFSFAMPYQAADLKRFLKRHAASPHLLVKTLCKTRKGRTVERVHVGKLDGGPQYRILLTCRHHACEMMASYCLEGIIEGILAETDDCAWFRQNVEVMTIPLVDKDGVEDGDQGKNRRPHDHNRDYAGESIYPSVRALRQLVPKWSRGRLRFALDLHDPFIGGPHNEVIYQVGSPDAVIWKEQRRFGKILQAVQTGPLVYRAKDDLAYGKGWNTAKNYGTGKSFASWAGGLEGMLIAATIEIPYANAAGRKVTAATARAFGHDLARAIRGYLASR